jgi:hypothetical protein
MHSVPLRTSVTFVYPQFILKFFVCNCGSYQAVIKHTKLKSNLTFIKLLSGIALGYGLDGRGFESR